MVRRSTVRVLQVVARERGPSFGGIADFGDERAEAVTQHVGAVDD